MADIKILLVDDEEDFITSIAERLEIRNLKSQTAYAGEEAMSLVNEEKPDVMVLDLRMPGIDGMEVLRRVRKNHPDVMVIIQTGHGNDLDEAEARKLGVFDYLKKPVDIEFLIERIRAAYKEKSKGDPMAAVAFAEAGEHGTAVNLAKGRSTGR